MQLCGAAENGEQEQAAAAKARWREHLRQALTALHTVLEAQPRCAALLASRPALAPLLQCIHPFCRYRFQRCGSWAGSGT